MTILGINKYNRITLSILFLVFTQRERSIHKENVLFFEWQTFKILLNKAVLYDIDKMERQELVIIRVI